MGRTTDATVLMVGPDRSRHGGIVSVIDGYFNAGLPELCRRFDYLSTGVGRNIVSKSMAFARSLAGYYKSLESYEIVHLHMGPRGSYKRKSMMAQIAKHHGNKIILHVHSGEFARDFEEGTSAYRASVLRTFSTADRVIVLSEEWFEYFAAHICDRDKITILHNGVELPSEPCDPSSQRNVLFLGRLEALKCPEVLLRASSEALSRFPDMKIFFGGDGHMERYQMIAEDLGISDRCEFLGWISGSDKERLFTRSGIYCLPSKYEGMPMSLLEAMAHGIPVIATRVGGIPGVIENGISGLLMDEGDEGALAKLLFDLAGSPIMRTTIGLNGRLVVENKFNIQRSINELIEIYEQLYMESAK